VRARKAIIMLAGVPVILSLSGCLGVETTPEKSARAAAKAKTAVTSQKGLDIGAANAQVKVEGSALVQDPNGVAAVVRLKNTGSTQVTLPIAITVADAKGKKLYANDTPGLDPSLTSLPILKAGEEVDWVNNQILVAGKASKVAAVVGAAKAKAPGALPKIALAGLAAGRDADGFYAKGTIRNESAIPQKRIVITCVARDGAKVAAAGRAVIDSLAPAKSLKKPTTFTVFFIGDPRQAKLDCAAPPTVLGQEGPK
jgi:ribosomal protein S11